MRIILIGEVHVKSFKEKQILLVITAIWSRLVFFWLNKLYITMSKISIFLNAKFWKDIFLLNKINSVIKLIHFNLLSSATMASSYPVCEEYTFCSHLFPENAMCLVFIMTTWSPQSPRFKKKRFLYEKSLSNSDLGYL